jgi:saposin
MLKYIIAFVFLIQMCHSFELSKPTVNGGSSPGCVICEFVMKEAENYLTENSTEVEIENFLDNVCTKILPKTVKSDCDEYIDAYTPILLKLLLSKVTPAEVCTLIKLCTSTTVKKPMAMVKNPFVLLKKAKTVNSPIECGLCVFLTETIKDQLKNNVTDVKILDEALKICPLLPSALASQVIINFKLENFSLKCQFYYY